MIHLALWVAAALFLVLVALCGISLLATAVEEIRDWSDARKTRASRPPLEFIDPAKPGPPPED